MTPVLVTGATGNTGSLVWRELARAGVVVRAASRDPGPSGVRFDWADPGTHPAALAGVERMYLVAPVGVAEPAPIVGPVLERGLRDGLRRVVLLSSSATEPSDTGLGALHRLVTELVPEWAILRPSWFMSNFVGDHPVATGLQSGTLTTATGDGRVGFVDVADIASVATVLLRRDAAPNDEFILTGPQALSYAEVCATYSCVTGRAAKHVSVTAAERITQLIASGLSPDFAQILAGMDASISRGSEDRVTDTVHQITGRLPRSLEEFLSHRFRRSGRPNCHR
ncbi:ergot alkaloid biosynthesis protein [Mycobacterium sp. NPDC003323]